MHSRGRVFPGKPRMRAKVKKGIESEIADMVLGFETRRSYGLGWMKPDLQNEQRVFGFNAGDVLWLIAGIALAGLVTLIAAL